MLEEAKMRPTIAICGSEPEERNLGATHRAHHAGPLVLTSQRIVAKPNTINQGVSSQIVDVPVRSCGPLLMVGDPSMETRRSQCAPQVNVIPALKLHCSQAPDLYTGIARTGKD